MIGACHPGCPGELLGGRRRALSNKVLVYFTRGVYCRSASKAIGPQLSPSPHAGRWKHRGALLQGILSYTCLSPALGRATPAAIIPATRQAVGSRSPSRLLSDQWHRSAPSHTATDSLSAWQQTFYLVIPASYRIRISINSQGKPPPGMH